MQNMNTTKQKKVVYNRKSDLLCRDTELQISSTCNTTHNNCIIYYNSLLEYTLK